MYEEVEIEEGAIGKFQAGVGRKWQHMLDMSAPHTAARWGVSALVMITYAIRVYLINGATAARSATSLSLRLGCRRKTGPAHTAAAPLVPRPAILLVQLTGPPSSSLLTRVRVGASTRSEHSAEACSPYTYYGTPSCPPHPKQAGTSSPTASLRTLTHPDLTPSPKQVGTSSPTAWASTYSICSSASSRRR